MVDCHFAGSNLSKMPVHLWVCKCFSLVGATCGRPREFTERPYGCGGSNLSTVLVLCGDMAGNSASLRDSHALRLVSELPDLRAANVHRRRIRGSVCTGAHSSQQKRHPCGCLFCWLGWPDLNRRVPESKSGALPLGDIPIF